jgi:hypothetical protein
MAKKKASGGFVMTAAVREILQQDPSLKATQVIEALRKKYPGAKINEASCKVAFSNERGKLGIGKRRRRKLRKPGAMSTAGYKAPRIMKLEVLQAAKNFIAAAGSSEDAIAAIRQVASLQVK